jgi:dihydrofolate reductase
VISGRKTYESIGKPLPNRRNIVVSRQSLALEGCEVVRDLPAAVALARETDDCPFVIGGAQIYAEALPLTTRLYLTEIDRDVEGDTLFPELPKALEVVERRAGETPELTFVTYARAPG